jgi:predicted AAA+ superfamily ATPase
MRGVAQSGEFVDPALVPAEPVRVAAFDGENADPANGRRMEDDVLAFTPWGEIAYALAGKAGYERVRRSDEEGVAPGAETVAELFGGRPALVLLDELAIYLRKVRGRPGARDQLTAFLTSLFKAVEASPRAALVYTLAVGKEGRSTDAYGEENEFVAGRMAEAESVSARKATLLNPTEDDEAVHVLRRRLFGRVDAEGAAKVIEGYRALWHDHRAALAPEAGKAETVSAFLASYPLHPDVLDTFTGKTATPAAADARGRPPDRPRPRHAVHRPRGADRAPAPALPRRLFPLAGAAAWLSWSWSRSSPCRPSAAGGGTTRAWSSAR